MALFSSRRVDGEVLFCFSLVAYVAFEGMPGRMLSAGRADAGVFFLLLALFLFLFFLCFLLLLFVDLFHNWLGTEGNGDSDTVQ